MKKRVYFLLPLALLALLTSCDKEMSDAQPLDGRIEFTGTAAVAQSSANGATRGVEIDNATLQNFKVFAYYTNPGMFDATSKPNFMYNIPVAKTGVGGAWQYDPLMYWPNSGAISFFAYAPATIPTLQVSTVTTPGPLKLTYTVPNTVSDQLDLMVATPQYNKTSADLNAERKLIIPFKHALSSIVFQAKMTDRAVAPITAVNIDQISISGLQDKADYLYNGAAIPWRTTPDSKLDNYIMAVGSGLKNVDLKNQVANYLPLSTDNGHLMVLPQIVNNSSNIEVSVVFTGSAGSSRIRADLVKLIPGGQLQSGKRYIIKILVSLPPAQATLTCTAVDWIGKNVDVPQFD
ncbi:MAG: fimbrillin family protein [Alistipes sp.]